MQTELLYNRWFGKAIGTMAACIFAPEGPVGFSAAIIVGIGLGHLYDWWSYRAFLRDADGFAQVPRDFAPRRALQTPHLRYLFGAMGALAKTNGVVRRAHIETAENLIRRFRFDRSGRDAAIAWFNEGKSSGVAFDKLATECLGADEQSTVLRNLTLESMCEVAAVTPTAAVVTKLKQLGLLLGFSNARIGEVFGEAHMEVRRVDIPAANDAPLHASVPPEVSQAAHTLDVEVHTPIEGVKRSYRRLVSRYHPDKLAPNATHQERERAQQKVIELREALELLETYHAPKA